MDLTGKKILFIIPPSNFRDEELTEPRNILEGFKAKTIIASTTLNVCKGMLGSRSTPNLTIKKINVNDYDAIIFVGGSGSTIYWKDKNIINIIKEANLKGRIIASICLASGTLANSGILKGRNATGWPDTKQLIERNGGIYTGTDIEISNRIITAKGPGAAKKFGESIAKLLERKVEN